MADKDRLISRAEDFNEWYNTLVLRADMADYGPVRGTMIVKPYGWALWENIQAALDRRFKATGVENAAFPLLIPQSFIEKEASHVEGFAPELAVVTHGGGVELAEPLVVRPTSETIIGHAYARWIQSHRDLPLLINQWNSVVRWEMRTKIFLRTLEFYWQEGHTAHASAEEAQERTLMMLDIYRDFAVNEAAVPVIPGEKSAQERFAGAERTYTIEAMMGDRRALQSGTSHNLGQNFAKAFDIQYLDANNTLQHCWTTSWGLSTRFIGAIIMTHGDDAGLVMPPRLAPIQTVIVPIYRGDDERSTVLEAVSGIAATLVAAGIRVKVDDRDNLTPGFKFNDWELRGVPTRIEIGPRDLAKGSVALARRDVPGRAGKSFVSQDGLAARVIDLLQEIQDGMLAQATAFRDANTHDVVDYDGFREAVQDGFARAWWAGSDEDEKRVKEETRATLRCIPLEQPGGGGRCFLTGAPATRVAIFGRAIDWGVLAGVGWATCRWGMGDRPVWDGRPAGRPYGPSPNPHPLIPTMRISQSFGKTLRQAPADAEMESHQLLIRAGFIRPVAAGIFAYLPLGHRVLRRLERIVREEMDRLGGQELTLPLLHPAALWQASGRWDTFDALFKVQAGREREYALAPTHEEVVASLCVREIDSYRDLPQFVYQVSRKFRDEARPRGGLIRLREFIMKDAYSLDMDDAGQDAIYPRVLEAYRRVFARCAVPAVVIGADVGAMGGRSSHEFSVPHPAGEDVYLACGACEYAANVEAATFRRQGPPPAALAPLSRTATPDCRTIADVAAYLGVPASQTIKAVFYWGTSPDTENSPAAGRLILALVRGDLEINEIRLNQVLGGVDLRAATEEEIRASGAEPGYASPIGLAVAASVSGPGLVVLADLSLEKGGNFVVGANAEGYHYTGANTPRDMTVSLTADIARAEAGHPCPQCGEPLSAERAIEVGHCFKLGTRFSQALNATYLDDANQPRPITMGSYGIGLDRLMAVIADLHHDADGLIWPAAVAPYGLHLMSLGKSPEVEAAAASLYDALRAAGVEVLFDDRDLSAGVKFKDADLIGIPLRLTVGARGLAAGNVEVKWRQQSERSAVPLENAAASVLEMLDDSAD